MEIAKTKNLASANAKRLQSHASTADLQPQPVEDMGMLYDDLHNHGQKICYLLQVWKDLPPACLVLFQVSKLSQLW